LGNRENRWCVYIHISPSGKKYVGITSKDPKNRWGKNGHKYLEKKNGNYRHPAMANALIKYPNWNEWKHYILLQNETEKYAKAAEICLIKAYRTTDCRYGYNCTNGGDGVSGLVMPDVAKETLRQKTKERLQVKTNHPMYGSHRCGEENPFYGKKHTEESKEKMSNSHKGLSSGNKNPMYGKHHSETTCKKMSKNHADFCHEKHPRSKPVYCIELNELFWGSTGASNKYDINYYPISACCRHKKNYNSAGKHPITGELLHWIYIEEAIEKGYITQKDVNNYFNHLKNKGE